MLPGTKYGNKPYPGTAPMPRYCRTTVATAAITYLAMLADVCAGFSSTPLLALLQSDAHNNILRLNNVRKSSANDAQQGDESDESTTSPITISAAKGKSGQKTERQLRQLAYVMINDVEDLLKTGGAYDPSSSSSSSSKSSPAVAKALENIERMELLLQQAEAEQKDDDGETKLQAQIMSDLSSCLVRAYAKSPGVKDHAKLAEETFRDMRSRGLKPNVATACAVIDGYARSRRTSGPLEAERLLFELMDEAERAQKCGDENVLLPTSACCNACIKAWARRNSREGAERAQGILDRMDVLNASSSAAEGRGGEGGGRAIHPTVYSYATVVTAWNRGVGGLEAAERADAILKKLLVRNVDADNTVTPNTVLFNAVIDCWAQSSHPTAGTKALGLLKMMKELGEEASPDGVTYRSVINAWASSSHINAAKSAEEVMALAKEDGVVIDTRTYNVVLKAWSKSNAPNAAKRAEQLLVDIIEAHKSGDIIIGPDAYSFSTVLSILAKASEPGKAQRARDLLTAFVQYSNKSAAGNDDGGASRPNTSCYNTVLNACAFSAMASEEERKGALRIAVQTLQELVTTEGIDADSISFGTMLKAIANLVPPNSMDTRNQMASKIFERCANSGHVNDLVLNEFQRCVSRDCLMEVLGDSVRSDRHRKGSPGRGQPSVPLSSLPNEWKVNVHETKARRNNRRKRKESSNSRSSGTAGERNRTSQMQRRQQRKNGREKQEKGEEKDDGIFHTVPGFSIVETSWQSGKDL